MSENYKKTTEHLALIAGILQPMMTLPQAWKIYTTHSAAGVSLATWVGYAVLGLVFLVYGIVHKLRPIALTQVIWFTLQMIVVVGILKYG